MAAENFLASLPLYAVSQGVIRANPASKSNTALRLRASEPERQRWEIRDRSASSPQALGTGEHVTRPGHCRFPLAAVGSWSLLSLLWTSAHRDTPGHWNSGFPRTDVLARKMETKEGTGTWSKTGNGIDPKSEARATLSPVLGSELSINGCDSQFNLVVFHQLIQKCCN